MTSSIADDYMDQTMEVIEDDPYQCRACGQILEEGKAYELAGSRWHLTCFRCHMCKNQLGDDSNLLLLGDGSLVCNNCTYSCIVCDSKIEELAILTGEQAFCASCFRCRHCKRKIENLRYARTSQGILCMDCNESIVARRRKRSKVQQRREKETTSSSPMVTEKSLPALPPDVIPRGAFDPAPTTDGMTELSPRPRQQQAHSRTEPSSRSSSRPARSPERDPHRAHDSSHDAPATLQPSTYRKNRSSTLYTQSSQPDVNGAADGDSFLIPVALDPTPPGRNASDEPKKNKDDYFSQPKAKGSDSQAGTPHIAFQSQQQQGRQSSSEYDTPTSSSKQSRRLSKSLRNDGMRSHEDTKKKETKEEDPTKQQSSSSDSLKKKGKENISVRTSIGPPPPRRGDAVETPDRPFRAHTFADEDIRSDTPKKGVQSTPRSNTTTNGMTLRHVPNQSPTMSIRDSLTGTPIRPTSADDNDSTSATPTHSVSLSLSMPRPSAMGPKLSDTYMQPRAPPAPPGQQQHNTPRKNSVNDGSPKPASPKLPRWSAGGDFSLEEDMARIMGNDEVATPSSVLRRLSTRHHHGRTHSVESHNQRSAAHTRSTSEMSCSPPPHPPRRGASLRWSKPPVSLANHGARHSPVSMSPTDDPAVLKRQLKTSELRVAELERKFATENDLVNLNKKLIEKRKTVSVLDTQAEMMVRQLESLTGVVERSKQSNTPVDICELEETAVKDLWQKLEQVKITFMASLEQAFGEREAALEDKERAIADRDRALVEFEQLSIKNAQLVDMNNDLTHQIQERFKSQAAVAAAAAAAAAAAGGDLKQTGGGLGIYSHSKNGSTANLDMSGLAPSAGSSMLPDGEDAVVEGPTVVQVRRVQGKKFNWKKGKTVAQNIAKGVNRTVVAFQQQDREKAPYGGFNSDNIGLPYSMTATQENGPTAVPYSSTSSNNTNNTNSIASVSSNNTTTGSTTTTTTITTTHPQSHPQTQPPTQGPSHQQQHQQQQQHPHHHQNQLQQLQQSAVQRANNHGDQGNKPFAFFNRNKAQMPKSLSTSNFAIPAAVDATTTLFGSDLTDRADFERRQIPNVVSRCIEEVELRGMDVEGIYRKTGGNSQIKMIQDGFSQSSDYDISDPDIDITAVTSVLKQYFRKLPVPLLTFDVYERILESNAISNEAERCTHLKKTFSMMPQSHGDCLEFLMFHLGRVAQRESENLMSPKNLAVVFAPTIMRDTSLEREIIDMHAKNIAVQFIIENISNIFAD